MSAAARKNDATKCPLHGVAKIEGIIDPLDTQTNSKESVRLGDYAKCKGGNIDVIVEGAKTVSINGRYASRVATKLWHGGTIEVGSPNVLIGGPDITSAEIIQQAKERAQKVLKCARDRLERWNDEDKEMFKKYFGSDTEASRQKILSRVKANQTTLDKAQFKFGPADKASPKIYNDPNVFAHVYPADATHKVYLDGHFWSAPTSGTDNQTGTLLHEMSHFNDVGKTGDVIYGRDNALALATTNPAKAMTNADSYEYYMEEVQESCKGC